MLDLKKTVANYRIIVDTCFLMHPKAESFFLILLAPILRESGLNIIFPALVIEELNRHAQGSDQKGKLARGGLRIISQYHKPLLSHSFQNNEY